MLLSRLARFRLTFLGKFVFATFASYVVVASALAVFLIDRHQTAVENNEAVNAAGQISALATVPLGAVGSDERVSAQARVALDRLASDAKQLQYVVDLRVYGGDGRALVPASGLPDRADVRATLQAGDLWSKRGRLTDGESVRTEFLPFASPRATFVLAIDLSRDAMHAQAADEASGVLLATGVAMCLVFVSLVALAAGASREIERRRRAAETTFVQTLGVLAETMERRDPYTAGHSRRVATYARLLALELGVSPSDAAEIEDAALLHDLGKIGISDAVLLKPAKLDDRERAIMNAHPRLGSEIIANVAPEGVVACVLHHHERVDGTGYPDRLAGDRIPRGARIIAVADTFDAITTDRPYRRAVGADAALAEMRRVAGRQLEAEYVEVFAALVAAGAIVPPPPLSPDESLAGRFGPRLPLALG